MWMHVRLGFTEIESELQHITKSSLLNFFVCFSKSKHDGGLCHHVWPSLALKSHQSLCHFTSLWSINMFDPVLMYLLIFWFLILVWISVLLLGSFARLALSAINNSWAVLILKPFRMLLPVFVMGSRWHSASKTVTVLYSNSRLLGMT